MSQENAEQVPQATPEAAAPTENLSPIDCARRVLEKRQQPAASDAQPAAQEAALAGEYTPSAADAVLSGAPLQSANAEPVKADDPSIAKILELDRAARQERQQLEEMRRAFEAEKQHVSKFLEAQRVIEQGGSRIEALKALGMSYEELTAEVMNGKSADLTPITSKLSEMEKALQESQAKHAEELQKLRTEREQAEMSAQRAAWDRETEATVAGDRDRWSLLHDPLAMRVAGGRSASQLIHDTMERHWHETGGESGGEVLTIAAAADKIQAALTQQLRQFADQSSATARILGLSHPRAPTAPNPDAASTADQVPASGSPTPTVSTGTASQAVAGDPPIGGGRAADAEYLRRAKEALARRTG